MVEIGEERKWLFVEVVNFLFLLQLWAVALFGVLLILGGWQGKEGELFWWSGEVGMIVWDT